MVTGGHGQHGRLHLVAAPTHFCMSRTSSFHFLIAGTDCSVRTKMAQEIKSIFSESI
jgi:hypothetical protein